MGEAMSDESKPSGAHPALTWDVGFLEEALRGASDRRSLFERCEVLLAGLEWQSYAVCRDGDALCPECGWNRYGLMDRAGGHEPDCPLAALLSDLRKELGKP